MGDRSIFDIDFNSIHNPNHPDRPGHELGVPVGPESKEGKHHRYSLSHDLMADRLPDSPDDSEGSENDEWVHDDEEQDRLLGGAGGDHQVPLETFLGRNQLLIHHQVPFVSVIRTLKSYLGY